MTNSSKFVNRTQAILINEEEKNTDPVWGLALWVFKLMYKKGEKSKKRKLT